MSHFADDETLALIAKLQQQLAAEQLNSAKLREWIAEAPHRVWCMRLDPYDERDHGCTCGKEALTLPHDDSALREWGARLLEHVKTKTNYSGNIHRVTLAELIDQLRSGDWKP